MYLEGQSVYYVTDATQALILVPGSSINIDTDAGKVSGKGLGRDSDAIW